MNNPMSIDEEVYDLGIEIDKITDQRDALLKACKQASAALEAIVSATVASKEIELNWHHTRKHLTEAIASAENNRGG